MHCGYLLTLTAISFTFTFFKQGLFISEVQKV